MLNSLFYCPSRIIYIVRRGEFSFDLCRVLNVRREWKEITFGAVWCTIIVVIKCLCMRAIVLREIQSVGMPSPSRCVIAGKPWNRVDTFQKVIRNMLGKNELWTKKQETHINCGIYSPLSLNLSPEPRRENFKMIFHKSWLRERWSIGGGRSRRIYEFMVSA